MLKRLLLLLDNSTHMEAAAACARKLARDHSSELLLYPLVDKKTGTHPPRAGEEWLGPLIRDAGQEGIDPQVVTATPAPFRESLAWARSCDLTILPAAGADTAARCEKRLVQLLTRGGSAVMLPADDSPGIRSVAVAWDGSGASARALKLHLQLFHRPRFHYQLLHIGSDPERAQWLLDLGSALIQAHGATVETLALSGDPAERLLELAATLKPDHLILAPHRHRLMEQKRLGRTSRSLLQAGTLSLFMAG